jgi:hypothetical protein
VVLARLISDVRQHNFLEANNMSVYLFLSCEGWIRFGPFRWLNFMDEQRTIVDDKGNIIASSNGQQWTVSDPEYSGYFFCNPFITTTKHHPHPYNLTKPDFSKESVVENDEDK